MSARNVAGFMCDNTKQLCKIIRAQDQAAVNKNILSACNEGIHSVVIDQDKLDIIG